MAGIVEHIELFYDAPKHETQSLGICTVHHEPGLIGEPFSSLLVIYSRHMVDNVPPSAHDANQHVQSVRMESPWR